MIPQETVQVSGEVLIKTKCGSKWSALSFSWKEEDLKDKFTLKITELLTRFVGGLF